jgi:4-amino-4-deoxy-L-arabinose transferase-like glycosyltransferase
VAAVVLNSVLFPLSYFFEFGPDALLDAVSVLAGCLIPVAIGIAVLRYHLYDIDRLISRTVSWSLVTAGVVAVFALLVVGLQAALAGFTQGETVAVALSTIVAAALFQPARRRVQQAIDRRFDRGRYDANLTAAAFAERLRNDLDLDAVTNELHTTVGLAVRPTTAGIWLIERGPR